MTETAYSHQFDNGLVLVAEQMSGLESAAFTFRTPGGCRYDPAGREGLAAFSCDMSLRGAGNRDNYQFLQDLEILGVNRSESVTNTHMNFSGATVSSNLLPALELYADLLRRPHLPSDQVEASRKIILLELQSIEDDLSSKVMLELRKRQFPDPYGRASYGIARDIENVQLRDVKRFLQSQIRPNGTILGVAGKFDWPQLRDHVGELLASWAPVAAGEPKESPVGHKIEHIMHESQQTQIGIAFDCIPYRHPDFYQASAAISVLSSGSSSRLFTEVREKRGLCYTVYASIYTLRDRACVLSYAGTSAERAQETLEVMLEEFRKLDEGIQPAELDRMKARIKSTLIMRQEMSSVRSSEIAQDWYHLGRARSLTEVNQQIDALTCESINSYLRGHPAGDFAIVTLGPSPLEVPVGVS